MSEKNESTKLDMVSANVFNEMFCDGILEENIPTLNRLCDDADKIIGAGELTPNVPSAKSGKDTGQTR